MSADPLGLVDRLGYLYCAPCAAHRGTLGDPVRGRPHGLEPCDGCHRVLVDVPADGEAGAGPPGALPPAAPPGRVATLPPRSAPPTASRR